MLDSIGQSYQDVLDATPSDKFVQDANAFPVARAGNYRLHVDKKEARTEYKPDARGVQKPDRFRIHVEATILSLEDGTRKGKVFFDASPIEVRSEKTNRLDGASTVWGNLAKIHTNGSSRPTNREIADGLGAFDYNAYVSATFELPEGLKDAKTEEDFLAYQEAGYRGSNFVRSLKSLG